MSTMIGDGWIGVDLDGTLAEYQGWKGEEHIGPPIAAMVDRVKRWRAMKCEVRIFTARVTVFLDDDATERTRSLLAVVSAIQRWSQEHLGEILPITNVKDYSMVELWDDRCVQVVMNTGNPVGYSTRGFK